MPTLAALANATATTAPSKVTLILEALDIDDREHLEQALANPYARFAHIADALREMGHEVSPDSISAHVKREKLR